ncbi:hypothetical protein TruAng_011750 [Truncatella angustata]|nr:hypothetical protein TruAng_011750 [Truncatella angustata]
MAKRAKVLFFTNSDSGQSNVVLAVIYDLLRQNRVDVHIASWPALESRLKTLYQEVQDADPSRSISPITFHNLASFPGFGVFLEKNKDRRKADVPHPPGRLGAARISLLTVRALATWEPEEYLSLFDWAADLVKELGPALVVLDPFLIPIHDMSRHFKWNYAVLSPCTLAHGFMLEQPWFSAFWRYPAFSTGFPYPLPWSRIADNLYCNWLVRKAAWHPKVTALNLARKDRGIYETLGSFTPWVKDVPHICPSLPAIDLPMKVPPNVHNCGPILLASKPVASSDSDLLKWLQQRKTILMALGTHFEAYTETVRELALGLRVLLTARPDIQVLWKLKIEASSEARGNFVLKEILGPHLESGRVRVESWLKADPVAILRSGHILCAVHHGGANSYFESAWAGIPQVVLATWYDTFDYAARVEYLGIAPLMIDGGEFGDALLKAVGEKNGQSKSMRGRAAQLGEMNGFLMMVIHRPEEDNERMHRSGALPTIT